MTINTRMFPMIFKPIKAIKDQPMSIWVSKSHTHSVKPSNGYTATKVVSSLRHSSLFIKLDW